MKCKPYSAQTLEDLRSWSAENGGLQVIAHLDAKELTSSASNWNLRHLIAYRLLVSPEEDRLPIIQADHDDWCPVCTQDRSFSEQKLNHAMTEALIGRNPPNLHHKTDSELLQLPGGFFWIALAQAARPEPASRTTSYPRRNRKPIEREGYTNSASAILGSSSPIVSSSSEFDIEVDDTVDEDGHEARRSKPEEITVQLITQFLRHVLNLCLLQQSKNTEVRPRIERRMTSTQVAGRFSITAEDDGGICEMKRQKHGWDMGHPYLALLEAKKIFKVIRFDDKREAYNPIVSNEVLAQYLGEAVVAWKSNLKLLRHG